MSGYVIINFHMERNQFNFVPMKSGTQNEVFNALFADFLLQQMQLAMDDAALNVLVEAAHDKHAMQALPPWAQKEREKKALVELLKKQGLIDDNLEDFPIIIDEENGVYRIETDQYIIEAKINYLPREDGICGPANFNAEITSVTEKLAL